MKVEGLGKHGRKNSLTQRRPDRVGVDAVHRDCAEMGKRGGEDVERESGRRVGAWQTRERIARLTEVVKRFAVNGRN